MQQLEQHEQQRVVGRPFPKGTSGNPRGRPDSYRYREVVAALTAEMGGEDQLTATQRFAIDQIARLKARGGKRDPVRTANAIAKLMKLLFMERNREQRQVGPFEHLSALASQ